MNSINPDISPRISVAWQGMVNSATRLSSGQRITSARDDPAGLAVRVMFLADLAPTRQASRNTMDGISMAQTADSAVGVIGENLVRMRQLTSQAQNGTLSDQQKGIVQQEFDELAAENIRISDATDFNGIKLFEEGQTIDIALGDGDVVSLKTDKINAVSGDLASNAAAVQAQVDAAIDQVNSLRAGFGATANRLESAYEVLAVEVESIVAAYARISDADVAKEAAILNSNRVLAQAALASRIQANANARLTLQLLN